MKSTSPASPFLPQAASASLPPSSNSSDFNLEALDAALQVMAGAEESLHRLGEDRPKFLALEISRQKVAEARGAIDAILFPNGQGELSNREVFAKTRADALDALAAAERSRAGFIEEAAGDAEIDAAELKVRHAARAVVHAIAACNSLDAKEIAARRAAVDATWDRFWPHYLEFQNNVVIDLRKILANFEKIRRLTAYLQNIGACPAVETMPWPNADFLLPPAAAQDYIECVAKAPGWNEIFTAKRRSAA